jgi:hypothetical protein
LSAAIRRSASGLPALATGVGRGAQDLRSGEHVAGDAEVVEYLVAEPLVQSSPLCTAPARGCR